MSDNATQEAAPAAEATDTSVDTSVDTSAEVEASTESTEVEAPAKTEPEKDSFAKFRNEDGSIDIDKMSKSYAQLERAYSKRALKSATSVEEYSYDFGEGFQVDQERTDAFKEAALSKGITKDQYTWLMETYAKNLPAAPEAAEPVPAYSIDDATKALTEAWGVADGAEFKENMAAAGRAFREYAADADDSDAVWNHPEIIKAFARMGHELSEDMVKTKVATTSGESVQDRINALRAEPDYHDNPAKQAAMLKLYEQLA